MRDVQAAIISSSVSLCSPAHLLISGSTSCAAAGAAMARMPATIPGQMALRYGAGWVSHMVASVRGRPFKPRGGRSPMDRMIETAISGKTGIVCERNFHVDSGSLAAESPGALECLLARTATIPVRRARNDATCQFRTLCTAANCAFIRSPRRRKRPARRRPPVPMYVLAIPNAL